MLKIKICQKAIKDLDLNNRGINIVLIKTNGKNHRPVGNSFINEGDVVTVIGQTHDVTSPLNGLMIQAQKTLIHSVFLTNLFY
ncbi:TrkA C-terminal domain-containing protein [Mycoplasmopsis felis]|uniref:TrkA C-terminal domain-containing protein n=1 Tax=Mycoplasmopsis felis TaxID=33923 RepID=UPI0021AEF898|nr:TrkA C-terminal domain-containing protein [Mycoplasmopsis felis]UWV83560.1 TrkA C-terminal domain-containing protein [Mycoplasmopsis felis]